MKKRFGFDIDGTITDAATFIPYINRDFNQSLTLEDISDYDLAKVLDISSAEFFNWMEQNQAEIYAKALLADHVENILHRWNESHELVYITARHKQYQEITMSWFNQTGIPFAHVELVGHYNKIAAVQEQEIDIFFEDKHDNAVMIAEACSIPVLLFDTPYNRMAVPENVIRVSDWLEADQWIKTWLK